MPIKFLNDVAVDSSVLYVDTINNRVGVGTSSPDETFTLQTQATGLGNEGIFIKNPFAGTSPIVNSKNPFLSLATSTTSAYNSTIYMGRNATATNQESKIEWSNANDGLSIYVKGTGTYREHVRFGNLSSGTPRTYFGGNVGIGTTGPSEKLSVASGNIAINNSTSFMVGGATGDTIVGRLKNTLGVLTLDGESTRSIRLGSATNGEVVRIDNTNNRVGIGTTSPGAKLEVNGNIAINAGQKIQLSGSADSTHHIYHDATTDYDKINYSSGFQLEHHTSGIQMTLVGSGGNVGIGTTSPSQKLHVAGNLRVTGAYYDSNNAPGTLDQVLTSTATGVAWVDPSTISAEAATLVVIECKNTSGATITKGTPVYQTGTVGATDVIEIAVADASDENKMAAIGLLQTTLNNNGFGKVVITGELLNITTSPIDGVTPTTGDTIYVKSGGGLTLTKPTGVNFIQNVGLVGKVSGGNAGSITVSSIMRSNDVPTPLYVDHANQRLGIGTTSPVTKLDVYGTSDTYLTVRNNGGSNAGIRMYGGGAGISHIWHDDTETDPPGIRFGTSANTATTPTTQLYIKGSNGNVGIGTTSPSQKLQVGDGTNDDAVRSYFNDGSYTEMRGYGLQFNRDFSYIRPTTDNTKALNIGTSTAQWNTLSIDASTTTFNTNGSENMRITSTGNVGIGTTSPDALLDVGANNIITLDDTGSSTGFIGMGSYNDGTKNRAEGLSYYGFGLEIDRPNQNISFNSYDSNGVTTGGTNILVLKRDGNVGIGTASPGKKLDINGDTIFRGELVIDGDSSVHSRINQTSSYLEIVGNNTDSADGTRMWIGTGQTDQGFYVNASNHSFRDNSSNTRMIINGSSGNVGIGTTSPLSQLTVQSSNATAYDATIDDGQDSDGATIMAFNADNTTTDSFAQILFRNRSSNVGVSRIVSLSTAAASTALAFVTENSNTKAEKMRIASDGAIKFNTYGAGTLVTDSSGNITVSSGGGAGGPYLPLAGGTMSGNLEISKSSAKLILTDSSAGQASVDIRNSSLYARWILDIDDLFRVYNQTSGFDAFAIKSSGNVGIGTASPGEKLEVDGYAKVTALGINSSPDAYLSSLNARLAVGGNIVINTNLPQLYLRANSTSNTSDIRYQNSLKLTNGSGSTHLTVTSGGDVGIGTTSPSNKLDVNGNIEASRIILPTTGTAGGGTVTTPAGKLDIRSDSTWSNSAIIARTTTNQNPVLAFYRPSGGSATSYPWWLEANGSTFQIKTGSAANIGSETVSTKVTINSSGNVGINTTNPQTGLQLSSSADNRTVGGTDTGIIRLTNTYGSNFGAGGEIQFGLADVSGRDVLSLIKGSYTGFSSGNYGGDLEFHTRNPDGLGLQQRMTITDAGNVGIGTTSPTSKLTVVDDILLTGSSPSLTLTDATSSFVIKTNTAGEGILQTSGTSKPIRFFRNNGSNESMRINGDGNVGIGTTSPAAKLEVEGSDHLFQLSTAATAGSPYLSFNQAGTRRSFIQHADSGDTLKLASEYGGIDFYTGTSGSETEKMTIQSNGNVGIGITAPVVKLHIGTSSGSGSTTEEFRIQTGTGAGYGGNAVVNLNTGAFGKSGIYFGNNGSLSYANQDSFLEYDDFSGETKLNFGNTLTINKGTSSAIYIDSFGRVGLGTTSPQYQLQLSTNSAAKPTSSSWTVVSDERVKTNIRPYETGLQELLQIEPKLFDYNGKAGFDAKTKNNIGVIAQEIKDVMPETVKKYNAKLNEEDEEDTELYNFDSHALTFALINSVKELNAKIKNLETKIQTLENQ